jgi:hypothetical protein
VSLPSIEEVVESQVMYTQHFFNTICIITSLLGLHLIVVWRFEYTDDPESYTSGSLATGRASHAGKFEG